MKFLSPFSMRFFTFRLHRRPDQHEKQLAETTHITPLFISAAHRTVACRNWRLTASRCKHTHHICVGIIIHRTYEALWSGCMRPPGARPPCRQTRWKHTHHICAGNVICQTSKASWSDRLQAPLMTMRTLDHICAGIVTSLHIRGLVVRLHAGTLEDNERVVAAIVRDYHKEVKSHKDKLAQDHRVKKALDSLQHQSDRLVCSLHIELLLPRWPPCRENCSCRRLEHLQARDAIRVHIQILGTTLLGLPRVTIASRMSGLCTSCDRGSHWVLVVYYGLDGSIMYDMTQKETTLPGVCTITSPPVRGPIVRFLFNTASMTGRAASGSFKRSDAFSGHAARRALSL